MPVYHVTGGKEGDYTVLLDPGQVLDLKEGERVVPDGGDLTFFRLRAANLDRLSVFPGHGEDPWSANDWAVAVTGELGELCNMLKKVRRGTAYPGMAMPTKEDIAGEIADVQIYLDLLAAVLGVDLDEAVVRTFNKVSERWGLPQRL